MGLVASAKIRGATIAMNKSRQYCTALEDTVSMLASSRACEKSEYMKKGEQGKICLIVVAGDRGLAGGYNANVFRLTAAISAGKEASYLPIGKKSLDHYTHRGLNLISSDYGSASDMSVGDSLKLAEDISRRFALGEFDSVIIVYTKFASMISQIPVYEQILPMECEKDRSSFSDPMYIGDPEEILNKILPQYVGGVLYSTICEALASESAARRTAMNAANKNASEIIDTLVLKYNRARQAVITQEITEIVSGSEAL
jgi:F-type H+-transporting ATPase subunit gamma